MYLFQTVTLRGRTGTVAWGYYTPAAVGAWTVQKSREGEWTLTAPWTYVDRFVLARAVKDRQRPALFTAPRQKGRWCWPIRSATIGERGIAAVLGPPEY